MDQEHIADLRARAVVFCQQARARLRQVPVKAWVILGTFLVAAVLMALHVALANKDASLRVKVQHSLRSAQLFVWVDGDLAYSGNLVGSARKKLGLIETVQGSLSETVPVSSGVHQLRVRVVTDDGSVQEDTVSGEFVRNSQRTLSVVARRDDVSLNWQGAGNPAAAADSPASGRVQRYTSLLLLTAAGSLISALAGYAIRELPKHIAARIGEDPNL